jgi:nucleotidyltransferase substrate binding protein (TIGR01987 family)
MIKNPRLKKQYDQLKNTLKTFEVVLREPKSEITRDAAIQRFEYTVEILWKTLKFYLEENEGIVCNSPKKCARSAFKVGIIDAEETEKFILMIDDRNETVHMYLEKVAKRLFRKLPKYLELVKSVVRKLKD